MIELNVLGQLIQSIGLAGTVILVLLGIWFYRERGGYSSSQADAGQQAAVTQMALAAQERAIQLEDHRYRNLKQNTKLLMRVQQLEVNLMRLPVVEAEVVQLKKELHRTRQERDDALLALSEEQVHNARLIGRIDALEKHILKLERKLRRLESYERDKMELLDDDFDYDSTDVLHTYRDLSAGGGDAGAGDNGDDHPGDSDSGGVIAGDPD